MLCFKQEELINEKTIKEKTHFTKIHHQQPGCLGKTTG
jgi:hypothetical protein